MTCLAPFAQTTGRLAALLAIVVLTLQLLLPTLAQARGGDWIEICSEAGPVLIQVDLDGQGDALPCPGCGDCLLCGFAMATAPGATAWRTPAPEVFRALSQAVRGLAPLQPRYQRPVPRGPPHISQLTTGGASWI